LDGTSEAVTSPDAPEAVTAPDIPVVEASEEAHDDSQQVIQSRNSFKYKSLLEQRVFHKSPIEF